MRRPRTVTIDPSYLTSGDIGAQTAHYDTPFESDAEPTLRIVVDYFLQKLEEPQRTAVQMCVMEGISYAQAAEWFSGERGIKTDPKTVWRWAKQGVERLGKMFERAGWAKAIEPRLLFEEDDSE